MSVEIRGTVNKMEVDVNKNAFVNPPMTPEQAGWVTMQAENDDGTHLGTRQVYAPEVSKDYRIRTGQDNMVFNESFPGSTINTSLYANFVSTMTSVCLNGFAVLNNGLSVAPGTYNLLKTYRHFPCYKQYTTQAEMEIQLSAAPVTGNRCEWGLFIATTTAAPTDGVFFRLDSTEGFVGVMNYAGIETTCNISSGLIGVGITKSYLIYIGSRFVEFWIDNELVGEIERPAGQGAATSSTNLPMAFRNFNVTAVSTAQTLRIGNVNVTFGDQAMSKPWGHVLSGMGATSMQGQTGATLQSTALMNNSPAAAAAALANATAAAQFIGLGGIFNVLPTLTVGTDGILCSYQAPAGTAALPGRSLYITDIKLHSAVTTVLAGNTTPIVYACSLAYGHTGLSLGTAEGITSKSPRRLPLGIITHSINAPVGEASQQIEHRMSSGVVVVHPGEYIQVALRNLGSVTTTGALTFMVSFNGYWE
jgi:hypothetical protein